MKKEKKIKIFLAIIYLAIISCFLLVFFANFSLNEITSYDFIKNNNEYFNELKQKNFFIVSLSFILLTIIWVLLLGFGSPIMILAGFIFDKWIGSLYAALGLTIGSTLLYIFANYFLKDYVYEKFSKNFSNFYEKFKKSEFNFFLIYRFVGGIPFFISNILPTIFNIKIKNFFLGTFFGIYPQVFVWCSLGAGLDKIIKNNLKKPSITELIFSPEIYIPIFGFIVLLLIGILLKNIFYKE